MKKGAGVILAVVIMGAFFAACKGGGGGGGDGGPTAMPSTLTKVYTAISATICPTGGIQVDAGIDSNGNGVLDPEEVDSTQYVCNGLNGVNGTNGTNGTNGSNGLNALISVTNEPAGTNCANGGRKVSVGLDANKNNILDSAEVASFDYVCNGTNGADGTNGANGTNGSNGLNSLVSIVSEPAGSNCAGGGLKITSGLDVDNDNVLDPGEAGLPSYICNVYEVLANAGHDQYVLPGTLVTLDGSASIDANGHPLTYSWLLKSKPPSSAATLSGETAVNPVFYADKMGAYLMSLVVSNGTVSSIADTVTVTVRVPVPDTGQTASYTGTFGEDSDYAIHPMSFTDNGDGTIFDNVTGLTWQKCSVGQSGRDCATGTAATYNWYEASGTADATYNPGGATNICGNLSLAGTGWRLPTRMELLNIVHYGTWSPAINGAFFLGTQSAHYWSSTTIAGATWCAWGVSFDSGGAAGSDEKTFALYVRCVRGQ